jgi:hypothetical protein
LHSIENISFSDNIVYINVNGEDPYFQLLDIPVVNPFPNAPSLILLFVLLIFFICLFSFFLKLLKISKTRLFELKPVIEIPKNIFTIFLFIIFLWFAFQMLYFATTIKIGISPDEIEHIQRCRLFSPPGAFFLKNTLQSFPYGSLSTEPYFYHFLLGKMLLLNIFHIPEYLFLRILNICLSLFSLYFTLLLVKEITDNKWIQLTVLIVQSNILMFVFISSMVSYDNLINFLAVCSFLFLFRFIRNFSLYYLLLIFLTIFIGTLTKKTFAPLAVIEIIILLFYIKFILKRAKILFKSFYLSKNIITCCFLVIFIILNIILYGTNLYKYHQIVPSVDLVIGYDNAYKYRLEFARDIDFLASAPSRRIVPFDNFVTSYITRTEETVFGIMGHLSLRRDSSGLSFYKIFVVFSIILAIFNYKKIYKDSRQKILLFISFFYLLVIFCVNYSTYIHLKIFGLTLQGRYNFPILSLVIIFLVYNLLSNINDRIKIPLILLLTSCFIFNGFVWFILNVTQNWYLIQ